MGVTVLFGGNDPSPLVEIVLSDLPKSGGAPPETTGLGVYTGNVGDDTILAQALRPKTWRLQHCVQVVFLRFVSFFFDVAI